MMLILFNQQSTRFNSLLLIESQYVNGVLCWDLSLMTNAPNTSLRPRLKRRGGIRHGATERRSLTWCSDNQESCLSAHKKHSQSKKTQNKKLELIYNVQSYADSSSALAVFFLFFRPSQQTWGEKMIKELLFMGVMNCFFTE